MIDRSWRHARGELQLDRCRVMAIVNLTPDSFSDGGRWLAADGGGDPRAELAGALGSIVDHCRGLIAEGADILDLGGESTRPGAAAVEPGLERARVIPVIAALRAEASLASVPISVDTRRAAVAEAALAAGAVIVNDVSGLADPEMARVVADAGAGLVISHLRGQPATMQRDIGFSDLLGEIADELSDAVARAVAAGVARERIVVDPGIGFGKTAAQSAALVGASEWLERRTGQPVLIGASRKRFLTALVGELPAAERGRASVAAAVVAAAHGAAIVRVHDVAETVEALQVRAGIEAALAAELAHSGPSPARGRIEIEIEGRGPA